MTATLPDATRTPPPITQAVAFDRCACLHPDPHECAILRSLGNLSRQEAEADTRIYGGCGCICHDDYDEENW